MFLIVLLAGRCLEKKKENDWLVEIVPFGASEQRRLVGGVIC